MLLSKVYWFILSLNYETSFGVVFATKKEDLNETRNKQQKNDNSKADTKNE